MNEWEWKVEIKWEFHVLTASNMQLQASNLLHRYCIDVSE